VRRSNEQLFKPLPARSEAEKVAASVLAWWRFEDGVAGKLVSDLKRQMGAISARDFSGHNNHLFVNSEESAPSISDQVPTNPLGLVESENRLCLDDTVPPTNGALTRDLYVNQDVARTHMDQVNRYPLSDWTVEVSICPTDGTGEQVAVAKEEDQAGKIVPLFQLGLFGSPPTIGVEFVDEAGELVVLSSDVQPMVSSWWHVAVTCQDGLAKLFLAADGSADGYLLVGEASAKKTLLRKGGTWIVGRGSKEGRMDQDFSGRIDEVRISTKALVPAQFLFSGAGAADRREYN
jgi:hypothetical protein